MKNLKTKNFIFGLVSVSALAWIALSFIMRVDLSSAVDFLKLVPTVVTVDSVIVIVFTKWLWKFPLLKNWLVPYPNLNGTWLGGIRSDWIDPSTGDNLPPIPMMLTIKQGFFGLSCVMQTLEMRSTSFSEGFNIDVDRQVRQLSYSYSSRPKLLIGDRSTQHDGTVVFDIIESPKRRLHGKYWTERKTIGEIDATFHTRKILEELPQENLGHPMKDR